MQLSIDSAYHFLEENAGPNERLQWQYLRTGESPGQEALASFLAGQRRDGGWAPFWAPGYTSLDATCFRLAQAAQMGLSLSGNPSLSRAVGFLAQRQKPDGFWEEELSAAGQAPPWAQPGDPAARLYLTTNCTYWVSQLEEYLEQGQKAAFFLLDFLERDGSLPSFPQAHWLAAGAFYLNGFQEQASSISRYLASQVTAYSASELTWLLCTYVILAGYKPDELVEPALERLASLQAPDGRWACDDGPFFDAHTTLEALFVLKHFGYISFLP
jgi:hypothetical protein